MKAKLDKNGHEVPDPKPLSIPMGYKRPETLQEQVQRLIRSSMSEYAALQDAETFEEADDFDIEDDELDPSTPYEMEFDPVLGREVSPAEFAANLEYYRGLYEKAAAPATHPSAESSASEARNEVEGGSIEDGGSAKRSGVHEATGEP